MDLRAWWERLLDSFPGHVGRRTYDLNLVRECLALAAQQTLCTIPLLVAMSAIEQRFGEGSAGGVLARYLGLNEEASHDVVGLFRAGRSVSTFDLVVGLLLALVFATGVAATQQRAYEAIWFQRRGGVWTVWRQVLWVGGLAAYLVVVLYAGRTGHRVGRHVPVHTVSSEVAKIALQFAVSLAFFWWGQRVLLGGRIPWKALLPGAFVSALGLSVLVACSPLMSSQITDQVRDYGLIGVTFVLSVWLLVLSTTVFGGALVGAVWAERRLARTLPADVVAAVRETTRA